MTPPRICLITPGHLASTPRLVKEADALHAIGFTVRVIAVDHFPAVRPLDENVLSRAGWKCDRITLGSRPAYVARRLVQGLARRIVARQAPASIRLALWAHQPNAFRLAAAAAREPADLYLGHCIAGLAAAGLAAARRGAKLGFDAEDFHRFETSDAPPPEIIALENHWVPRCQHLTAASPLIADAYAEHCHVRPPPVVLNVFPIADSPNSTVLPAEGPPTLYWFSQTIGPGRGLESLVDLLGRMSVAGNVSLRGIPVEGFPDALAQRARAAGIRGRLEFLGLAPPGAMVRLAAGHAIGLSLEQTTPRNRDLCLTNKIFAYLLAGTPVLLSPTSAQRRLATELGVAALCFDLAAPDSSAELGAFLRSPDRRAAAGAHAHTLGLTRYNWDREKEVFLHAIRVTLASPPVK